MIGPLALLIPLRVFANPSATLPTEVVRDAEQRVEDLRGLTFRTPVQVTLHDSDTLERSLREDLERDLPRAKAYAAVRSLVAFELADTDLDLRETYAAVLTEQVVGYYDPESKILALVQDHPGEDAIDWMVADHELVHALQDQHFDLHHLTYRDWTNDDVELALRSLVEGDATYSMLAAPLGGADLLDLVELPSHLLDIVLASSDDAPVLGSTPPIFAEFLLAPYTHGARFVQALRRAGTSWDRVNDALATHPPLSTEQILHPERYLAPEPDWPQRIRLPSTDDLLGREWVVLEDNTFGELGTRVLLQSAALDTALTASEGWDGDRYRVWERGGPGGELAHAWWVTCDSSGDATQLRRALRALVSARGGRRHANGRAIAGWNYRYRGDRQGTIVRRGPQVLWVQGLPSDQMYAITERLLADTESEETRGVDAYAPPPSSPEETTSSTQDQVHRSSAAARTEAAR